MKSRKYDMDLETANQTLQNVFAACNQKPNTIPFEKIVLRKKAKTAFAIGCKYVSLLFLILVLLSPLCFYNNDFRVYDDSGISKPIIVEAHYFENDCFTIKFKGDNINYNEISVVDENGTISLPDEIIPTESTIRIYRPNGTLNIYVPDYNGNTLHAVLSINEDD